ncbi:MAG: S8 family serine peptidase [Bacteroidales bacterium]
MRTTIKYSLLASSLLFASCESAHELFLDEPSEEISSESSVIYEKGVIRVKLNEAICENLPQNAEESNQFVGKLLSEELTDYRIESVERLYPYAGKFEKRTREMGMHLWYVVRFDKDIPQTKMSDSFIKSKDVLKVEKVPVIKHYHSTIIPNLKVSLNQLTTKNSIHNGLIFNDPLLADQWHYKNDGTKPNHLPNADVNVFPVWEKNLVGNPDVIVCVVDGGVDYRHEDLHENMYVNEKELNGTPGVDDDGNGYVDDIYGYNFVMGSGTLIPHDHGTHVAGIIAAKNDNGIGIAGLAGGKGAEFSGVKIMSAQIFTENGSANGSVAIKYGADNGAVISQNSWGYPLLTEVPESDRLAIEYFTKYAGVDENGNQTGPIKGGIVVFAAGNENRAYSVPGMCDDAVAVTSIAPDYKKAYYSNYGIWADIAAPGGQVTSEYGPNQAGGVLSTTTGNTYQRMQGSSMACPHVSGAFALLVSELSNNNVVGVSGKELVAKLLNNTRPVDNYNPQHNGLLGKGLLDIYRAVGGNSSIAPDRIHDLTILQSNYNSVELQWTVPVDEDDATNIGFSIYCSEKPLDGVDFENPGKDIQVIQVGEYTTAAGTKMQTKITGLFPGTTYYVGIRAFDYSGNMNQISNIVTTTTQANGIPVISARDGVEISVKNTGTAKLRFDVSDPDKDKLVVDLRKGSDAESFVYNNGIVTLFLNGAKAVKGTYKSMIVVTDPYGAKATQEVTYTISEQSAPIFTDKKMTDLEIIGYDKTAKIDWTEYVIDEDGDVLDVQVVSSDPDVVTATIEGNYLILNTRMAGSAKITMEFSDRTNPAIQLQFDVSCIKDQSSVDINQIQFKLFPNPVIDNLFIEADTSVDVNVRIKNSRGNQVYKSSGVELESQNAKMLNLSQLKAGQYQIEIEANGKTIKRNLTKL